MKYFFSKFTDFSQTLQNSTDPSVENTSLPNSLTKSFSFLPIDELTFGIFSVLQRSRPIFVQRAACSVWRAAWPCVWRVGLPLRGVAWRVSCSVRRAACGVQRGLVCGEVRKWSSLLPLVPAAGLVLK